MKKKILLVILIIIIVIVIGAEIKISTDKKGTNPTTNPSMFSANTNVDSNNFAFSFLQMEFDKKNIVYSPLSIKYALNMLNEGATGNTKTQIENVIKDLELTNYSDIDKVLSLANSVYIRERFTNDVKPTFTKTLTDRYSAEVKYDSFENANNINNWIENKTFGRIKDMVPDDIVQNLNTVMLLINALAIDMNWESEFKANDTTMNDFYLDNSKSKKVDTMHKETSSNSASYYKTNDITALAMNLRKYNDTQLEFIAIMPNNNLESYLENFSIKDLSNITSNLTPASNTKDGIKISIPKFSYEYELSLKADLQKLGITDAFSDTLADFTNISTKKPLYVGGALHKANIDFEEKGIKAAASTVIYYLDESASFPNQKKPIEVTIDKPFLYLIRDKNTNEIWFVGTIYEPIFEKN